MIEMRARVVWLALWVCAQTARPANIQLRSGHAYSNVTILSRTETNLEVQVPYGVLVLPLREVDFINATDKTRTRRSARFGSRFCSARRR
jgi:hypothetical protein